MTKKQLKEKKSDEMDEVEYRSVIKFLLLRKQSPSEILQQLQEGYKESCPSKTTVYYWIREFRGGRQSVFTDTSKSGRPEEIPAAKEEECAALIRKNRHISIDDVAATLRISHGTVSSILSSLGVRKLCSRFVPKFITSEMAERRLAACCSNWELFDQFGHRFFNNIVTEDETSLNLFLPMSRRESTEWCFPDESAPRKLKTGTSHGRCSMLSVFWSIHGILHVDVLPKGHTISGAYYADLLDTAFSHLPRTELRNKYLLHDNASIHTAAVVRDKISQLKLKVLEHPPYSPDLAPSDFCLFRHLKKTLRGQAFESPSEVELHVRSVLNELDADFFKAAFEDLVKRWKKCVESNGFYIEK